MTIVNLNEPVPDTPVDLITTFNFFLGIDVVKYYVEENNGLEYRIVTGKKGEQEYIIIWRNYDEDSIDLASERDWVKEQPWFNTDAILFCNGDNAFGASPIEPEFSRLMNEPPY